MTARDKSPYKLSVTDDEHTNKLIRELIKKRGIIKGRLTKFSTHISSFSDGGVLSPQERADLKLRRQGADRIFVEFNTVQSQLEEIILDSDLEQQLHERELFEDSYYKTLAQVECMLGDEVISCHKKCSKSSVKLPTVSVPTFDGSYERWLEFRDTFLSLVHNQDISDIQKFHYLKASLKGSAQLIIDSIEFSANNYSVAWQLLLDRYNNTRLLVQNHVKALFTLTPLTKESSSLIRTLIDTILKNMRALKILGEPTESWDTLINYIIISKLDKTTEREWESHKSTLVSNGSNKAIKLEDLIQFLKNRADMLETLQLSRSSQALGNEPKKPNPTVPSKSTSHCNVSSTGKLSCFKCNANHPIYSCKQFIDSDLESKLQLVREKKLCANCLRTGHTVDNCKFGTCKKCNIKHNSLLHSDNANNTVAFHSSMPVEVQCERYENAAVACAPPAPARSAADTLPVQVNKLHINTQFNDSSMSTECVLLSTAIVEVADTQGVYHKARALLDSGSQSCIMTESLCQLLNAQILQSTLEIRGVGNSVINCSKTCNIDIRSCVDNTYTTNLKCFVLKEITSTMPNASRLYTKLYIPSNVQLADPQFLESRQIDLLIGADKYWELMGEGTIRLPTGPYLQNTKLGWIVSGPIYNNINNNSRHYNSQIQCNFSSSIETQLRLFWELEEVPKVRDALTEEERACEEHFIRTTTRMSDGRFCVRIPFNQSPDSLGDTHTSAERQFLALERRLQRSPEYKSLYANFMQEYLDLGHMTKIDSYARPHYFMPHHGVYREHSTTTKLRVVFNASAASSNGKSLNDLQMVGPPIQGDLISILLRFRQHKYVICADVCKMYRQCLIDVSQRNLQLILWRADPSEEIGVFQLNTVTYGTASAPFLSVRCLKQLAIESPDPEVQRIINEDMYVDDVITGLDDKHELLRLCSELKNTLAQGCLPLRKWIYNFKCDDDDVLSDISKELTLDENVSSKTLGLGWNNLSDDFYFNTQCQDEITSAPVTKRLILSNISQIFDPLGLLSPVIIVVKVLLQQLWLLKLGWDDTVPHNVVYAWNRFVISLRDLQDLRVPRHAIGSQPMYIELHIFTDASQTAYGACIYVRTVNNDGTISVHLLISKAKVAPLKPISIPRLELCGALLGARLYDKVRNSLHLDFASVVFWTDSTIVLGWLRMSPNRLKPFVQNRTAEIQELTRDSPWYHVSTKHNPADLASRGTTLSDLSTSSVWWQGPEFLRDPEFSFDKLKTTETSSHLSDEQLPELKSATAAFVTHDSGDTSLFPFNRFSQFNRMQRAMAYVLRFIHNSRNKHNKHNGILSVDELYQSQIQLVKLSQKESYPVEYDCLLKGKQIKSKTSLSKLNLFLDDNKIMRVGGRLEYSDEFGYNKKHPAVLSSKHHFTLLLFRHEHTQLLHAGPQALLFHIRESWWPMSGRNLARQVVHQCVTCTRLKGKTLTPLMGNLPKERITPGFPFIRCGVDYAGPILIMNRKGRGARTTKCYVCLFICFVTRAIHLELVSDLSSQAYLLALKRFVSRRGKPSEIFSDNGRNFVGLKNDFSNFLRTCSPAILEYATSQNINFHFIPCYASHFGGLWESGIKSCKYHIRRVVGNAHLTFEELTTVLVQIEAILNSRPLSPLSSDPNDLSPLTPAHFLVGRPLTAPVSEDLRDVPATRLQRFQRVEQLRQHFWSRWAKEYISQLQIRTKWTEHKDELKPDTLVVIKDDNLPPLKWQMGRVLRTIPGLDGISRVADIRTATGDIRRAAAKICPLHIESVSLLSRPGACSRHN